MRAVNRVIAVTVVGLPLLLTGSGLAMGCSGHRGGNVTQNFYMFNFGDGNQYIADSTTTYDGDPTWN